jgi:hypothetical protein
VAVLVAGFVVVPRLGIVTALSGQVGHERGAIDSLIIASFIVPVKRQAAPIPALGASQCKLSRHTPARHSR